jgi:hypothetical protein
VRQLKIVLAPNQKPGTILQTLEKSPLQNLAVPLIGGAYDAGRAGIFPAADWVFAKGCIPQAFNRIIYQRAEAFQKRFVLTMLSGR